MAAVAAGRVPHGTVGPVSPEQREIAALLYAGPRSVLTGIAALRQNGFRVPALDVVDVVVPADFKRQSMEFARVQRSTRMPPEVCVQGEVRFVLPARAVADAARTYAVSQGCARLSGEGDSGAVVFDSAADYGVGAGAEGGIGALEGGTSGGCGAESVRRRRGICGICSSAARFRRRCSMRGFMTGPRWWRWRTPGGRGRGWPRRWTRGSITISAEDWQQTMRRHDRLVAHGSPAAALHAASRSGLHPRRWWSRSARRWRLDSGGRG